MRKYTYILFALSFVCCSCSETENTPASVVQLPNSPESIAHTSQKIQPENIETEIAIQYDTIIFPNDSAYMGKLLFPGNFHGDEVWPNAQKEKWYGIFTNGSSFYLSQTKIKTTRAYDPVVDEDTLTDRTGWEVRALHKDTALYLISGFDFLKDRNIQPVKISTGEVFPGDTLSINYQGTEYKLYSTGGKKKTSSDTPWYEVWNYKLFLQAKKEGIIRTELLVSQPRFDDAMISILFIADIDGDGLLDFIIDTSSHYNASIPTLYLSKPAEKEHLIKVVASLVSVGC